MNQKSEIYKIADNLLKQSKRIEKKELNKLEETAINVGKSWSGSWLGYHSRVYYRDLQPVPPGARFSKEWGQRGKRLGARVTLGMGFGVLK